MHGMKTCWKSRKLHYYCNTNEQIQWNTKWFIELVYFYFIFECSLSKGSISLLRSRLTLRLRKPQTRKSTHLAGFIAHQSSVTSTRTPGDMVHNGDWLLRKKQPFNAIKLCSNLRVEWLCDSSDSSFPRRVIQRFCEDVLL